MNESDDQNYLFSNHTRQDQTDSSIGIEQIGAVLMDSVMDILEDHRKMPIILLKNYAIDLLRSILITRFNHDFYQADEGVLETSIDTLEKLGDELQSRYNTLGESYLLEEIVLLPDMFDENDLAEVIKIFQGYSMNPKIIARLEHDLAYMKKQINHTS